MKRAFLTAAFWALACSAQAGVWLCVAPNDRQSIQDKPCASGWRTKSYAADRPSRAAAKADVPVPARPLAGKPGVVASTTLPPEPKLQRNKGVICNLLNTEKSEAQEQIAGRLAPPTGENPRDNLLKIERQRARVGCDA